MKCKLLFLILINSIGLQFSCAEATNEKIDSTSTVRINSNIQSNKNSNTQENKLIKQEIDTDLERFKSVIYMSLMEDIYHTDLFHKLRGRMWVAYGRETISIDNSDIKLTESKISPDLIEDFKHTNLTSEELDEKYGVKAVFKPVKTEPDLEKLFIMSQKKYPQVKASVVFSRIGFNKEKNQALVFVKFFSVEKKLLEKYCLLTLAPRNRPDGLKSFEITELKWF